MNNITVKNIDDKNELFEIAKKDAEETMKKYKELVEKDLQQVSNFTNKDLDKLIKMIFDSCQDITEIEYYINVLKELMIKDQIRKDKYIYQKGLTKKDIFYNNIYTIYWMYALTSYISMSMSNNPITVIQNFVLLITMQVLAFKINVDYFTSEHYKKKITSSIKQIDESVDIDNYNIKELNKFYEMSIDELKIEVAKLFEIIGNDKNVTDVNSRISQLLKGINMEFVLDDNSILVKKRKR